MNRAAIAAAAIAATLVVPAARAQERTAQATDATLAEARDLITRDQPQAAIRKLESLPERGRIEVAHLLGVAYYHADDYPRAIEQLSGVVARLPVGATERREPVQVLGLCQFLTGHFAEAIPLLEETRQWASANPELGYVLGQAYVQTRQPERARGTLAATFGVPPA